MEYACQVFHSNLPSYLSNEIERIQRRAMHVIFPDLSYNDALAETKLSKFVVRWEKLSVDVFSNIVKNDNHKLAYRLPPRVIVSRNMRNPRTFEISMCETDRFKKSFIIVTFR
jgi:hypothetical protein